MMFCLQILGWVLSACIVTSFREMVLALDRSWCWLGMRSGVGTGCADFEAVPFPERALEVTCIDLRSVLRPQSLEQFLGTAFNQYLKFWRQGLLKDNTRPSSPLLSWEELTRLGKLCLAPPHPSLWSMLSSWVFREHLLELASQRKAG